MHQTNTYFCDQFVFTVYFQMESAKRIFEGEIWNSEYKRVSLVVIWMRLLGQF